MKYESIKEYSSRLDNALSSDNQIRIEKLSFEIISRVDKDLNIFLIGNGGSHVHSQHIVR